MKRKKMEGFKLFLFILPCMIYIFIFSYMPLKGWAYAFTDYKLGYQWDRVHFVGLDNFKLLIQTPAFLKQGLNAFVNTVGMGLLSVLVSPIPLVFAVLLNEMRSNKYRKVVQTLTTIPNFVSWSVIYSMAFFLFSNSGVVNNVLLELGVIEESINFLASDKNVWLQMTGYTLWKTLGWSAIIYFASLASIDQELYEAAAIDGAGRWAKVWYISIPGLLPTYVTLLVMSIGNFLNTGMEQYYIFQNAMNRSSITVLDLYVYELGIGNGNVVLSTIFGIMKSLVAIILLVLANQASQKIRGSKVF